MIGRAGSAKARVWRPLNLVIFLVALFELTRLTPPRLDFLPMFCFLPPLFFVL